MEILNGDIELHVEVDGDPAAPPVLLLHGITSSVRTWSWLVPDLVDRYRVLRLDFRGHGRSGRFAGGYDFPGYVADAAAACAQVAERPAVVIGHSLGGGTAAALAQRHPELVRAVLLEDPALTAPDELRTGDGSENALLGVFALMRESVPRLQSDGVDVATLASILGASPSISGGTMNDVLHADAVEAMAASLLELDASVLDPVLQGALTPAFDAAAPIPVPVLLLAADPSSPDCVAGPGVLDRLRSTTPHAEARPVAGAGHLIHDELAHRDEFRREVLAFLDRTA